MFTEKEKQFVQLSILYERASKLSMSIAMAETEWDKKALKEIKNDISKLENQVL